ncbi:MAG: serine hydrolase domain-containing protein [Phycisphaerae bacterium]|nr:serine hydrolase domain-containing protein [Phycisphaerae bacterium]
MYLPSTCLIVLAMATQSSALAPLAAALVQTPPSEPEITRVPVPPEATGRLLAQPEGEPLKTSRELLIMEAWPVEQSFRVTKDRLFVAPYNRWGLMHADAILPTAVIGRGKGPVVPLLAGVAIDVDDVMFDDKDGRPMRVGDFFAATGLDGLLVLHKGKVVFERYENGMSRDQPHMMLGASAAFPALVALTLIHEGRLNAQVKLIDYLATLEYSAWRGTSLRALLDMTASVRFSNGAALPAPNQLAYEVACGLVPPPKEYVGPLSLMEFVRSMKDMDAERPHGDAFRFIPTGIDVTAELVRGKERATLARVIEKRIWSKLGAEHDARVVVDAHGTDLAALGFIATVPDMARFAQMLANRGQWNGQEVVPGVIALDVLAGGNTAMLARSDVAKLLPGGSYNAGWWNTDKAMGAAFLWGAHGQTVWINQRAEVVIVRVSSHSSSDSDFLRYNEIRAMDAIVKRVAGGT